MSAHIPNEDARPAEPAESAFLAMEEPQGRHWYDWDEVDSSGLVEQFQRDARAARTLKDLRTLVASAVDCIRCAGKRVAIVKRQRDEADRQADELRARLAQRDGAA